MSSDKIREEVKWFAEQMEAKLKENDYKKHWGNCSHEQLVDKLKEEIIELEGAYQGLMHDEKYKGTPLEYTWEEYIRECADVSNILMMLADKARTKIPRPNRGER